MQSRTAPGTLEEGIIGKGVLCLSRLPVHITEDVRTEILDRMTGVIGDPQLCGSIHLEDRVKACPAAFNNSSLNFLEDAKDLASSAIESGFEGLGVGIPDLDPCRGWMGPARVQGTKQTVLGWRQPLPK